MPQTKERRKQYTNICVEVTRPIQEEISNKAKSIGLTKSELIRKLIRDYLSIEKEEKWII